MYILFSQWPARMCVPIRLGVAFELRPGFLRSRWGCFLAPGAGALRAKGKTSEAEPEGLSQALRAPAPRGRRSLRLQLGKGGYWLQVNSFYLVLVGGDGASDAADANASVVIVVVVGGGVFTFTSHPTPR